MMKNLSLFNLLLLLFCTVLISCGDDPRVDPSTDTTRDPAPEDAAADFCALASTYTMPSHNIDRDIALSYMTPFFASFRPFSRNKVYGFDIHKDWLMPPAAESGTNHCGVIFYLLKVPGPTDEYKLAFAYTGDFNEGAPFPPVGPRTYTLADKSFKFSEIDAGTQMDKASNITKVVQRKYTAADINTYGLQFAAQLNTENPAYRDIGFNPYGFIHYKEMKALIENDAANFTGIRIYLGLKAPFGLPENTPLRQLTLVAFAVDNEGRCISKSITYDYGYIRRTETMVDTKTPEDPSGNQPALADSSALDTITIVKYPVVLERTKPPW